MNGGNFENERYDELINQAARMPAGEERFEVLQEAESIFIDQEQGVIPIYHYTHQQHDQPRRMGRMVCKHHGLSSSQRHL
ncbi:MAG: hypothetical protein U5P10_03110 [Spirochaetia bacterium]|nr:hypothetical protein [Spirochaetia bacterium]